MIEKDSQGYRLLHRVCAGQNITGTEEFFLHESITKHHIGLFSEVKYHTVFEGTGVGNDMDLLPYHGEWYVEQVLFLKNKHRQALNRPSHV